MKPHVLLMSRLMALVLPPTMEEHFTVHRYMDAPDKEALVADIGPDIRAIATDGGTPTRAALMQKLPNLEIIACCSVGYDSVDLDHTTERGILVTYTPDVLNDDVANEAVALVLATSRNLVFNDHWVRDGTWRAKGAPALGRAIRDKTMGILGLGRIGKDIARKLEAFGCSIAYHGRSEQKDVPYRYYANLVEMARDSDFVIVICPGGEETRHLVDRAVLDALGPEGTLINVARGSVVDEPALVAALQESRLGGAGLDVFYDEPNVPEALIGMDNVVLQPHQGSATLETRRDMAQLTLDNLIAHFAGKPLPTPVA